MQPRLSGWNISRGCLSGDDCWWLPAATVASGQSAAAPSVVVCVLQTVELQLPFTNHQIEAAKRTYGDKHPAAKDKEQAAKLRNDIGRSNDKGERVLEYAVTCSNSLLSFPQNLSLKAAMPASAAAAAAGRAAAGASPPVSPPMQQQRPAADGQKGKDENVMKLQLKPVGAGVYPARLTLTSPYDVRVVDVEVTAQSMGQTAVLELECPARQQVSGYAPLHAGHLLANIAVSCT